MNWAKVKNSSFQNFFKSKKGTKGHFLCWNKSKKGKNGKVWYSYIVLRWTELRSKIQDFRFFFFFFKTKKGENRGKCNWKTRKLDFLKPRKARKTGFFEYCYIVLRWTELMSKIQDFRIFFFFFLRQKSGKIGKNFDRKSQKSLKLGFLEA